MRHRATSHSSTPSCRPKWRTEPKPWVCGSAGWMASPRSRWRFSRGRSSRSAGFSPPRHWPGPGRPPGAPSASWPARRSALAWSSWWWAVPNSSRGTASSSWHGMGQRESLNSGAPTQLAHRLRREFRGVGVNHRAGLSRRRAPRWRRCVRGHRARHCACQARARLHPGRECVAKGIGGVPRHRR
jgi:hypothetical protein